jgi:release factor glutamine methyltransferase
MANVDGDSGITIAACLAASPLEALETRILLMHVLGFTRIQLITRSDYCLSDAQARQMQQLIQRRVQGEPIAYIVGLREFYGLDFKVTPAVLIPRPDTELLVELAIRHTPPQGSLLDLGTGSGAIAIALAHCRRDLQVSAVDLSPAALQVAADNALAILGPGRLQLLQGDWYAAVPGQRYSTIVSNPPYIVAGDEHLSQGDLRFEPLGALTDHADGLSAYRRIVAGAKDHLSPDGWLLMEHGYDQAGAVRDLLAQHGYRNIQSWRDLAGIERVSGGCL